MTDRRPRGPVLAVAAAAVLLAACGPAAPTILASGSSTVAPITRAVAAQGGFDVEILPEGTGDGFARFCTGGSSINNASTPIPGPGAPVDYQRMCAENGVEFIELPIALDALTIVRSSANTFATDLTRGELEAIWAPYSQVRTWADVRPQWPAEPITLYGRPAGSGTADVFAGVLTGEAGALRDDYRSTHDLDELVSWIADDDNALGFMDVGTYLSVDATERGRLTNVAIDGVQPTLAAVQAGEYEPFTRPLLIYVSVAALEEDGVPELVEYYLDEVQDILPRVFVYRLPDEAYPLVRARFDARVTGTMWADGVPDLTVLERLGSY